MPLADRLRPKTLEDVVGQAHILGKNKTLRRMLERGTVPNLIFYGPPGVGKTTVATILAKQAGKKLCKLNGTTASTADLREVLAQTQTIDGMEGVVLYLDEIQYLNKKQQQTLLEFMETGAVTLIASTTENPYFYVYNAILSRSLVFEFKSVQPADMLVTLQKGFDVLSQEEKRTFTLEDGLLEYLGKSCGGDVRRGLNLVEALGLAAPLEGTITLADAKELAQDGAVAYDKMGDVHYDLASALQKSIRGSDENAALHYLARFLCAGDMMTPSRRLLVIASEDIGLAYPMAAVIVKSCVDSAFQLGLPEARIPLAQAVVLLATAPKSNSSYMGINQAMADVQAGRAGDMPRCLQNVHCDGEDAQQKGQNYLYPHDYPKHYVPQTYMPADLQDKVYYQFGDNKQEQAAKAYRAWLMLDNTGN